MNKFLLITLFGLIFCGCAKNGQDGAPGINGQDGAPGINGQDLKITEQTRCSAMFHDYPSYYGVYPEIEITSFSNGIKFIYASVAINNPPNEFQKTSDSVWVKSYIPYISVLNLEYWVFNIEGNNIYFSNQSGSYKRQFTNCGKY